MRLKDVVTESRRASAESVLRYVQRQHHDFRMDSEILKYPHWQLRTVSLDQLNLYDVERDDPLNRVLDIDSEHIETLRREGPAGIQSRPIVVNASGEIIDGNHRAIAAQEMGMESIPAWQPMAKNITEVFVRPGQLTKSYSAKQMVDLGIKPRRGGYYVSARDWADIVSIETGRETIEQVLARRQGLAENFADGRKPGRRGLSKRMGVNCKQSVSKLRSIAKNSSGERQRMAHWCANMKSGRRKSK